GFTMFQELMASIWEEFVRVIFHVEVNIEPAQAQQMFDEEQRRSGGSVQYSGGGGEERPSAISEARAGVVTAGEPDAPQQPATSGNGGGGVNPATVVKTD